MVLLNNKEEALPMMKNKNLQGYVIGITLVFATCYGITAHSNNYVAQLTDETVNKGSHFELSGYVKAKYQVCYNEMYSHLKWPDKFKRPGC
jgi:hypothetical protein